MTITIELLLSIITATGPTTGSVQDLCDVVDMSTGVPLLCEPHPDGAPVYDGDICCTDDGCSPANEKCPQESLYHCELGERHPDGGVACYFEVPYVCDVLPCASASSSGYQVPPQEAAICCNQGICWPTTSGANDCELQDIMWCDSVVSNPDGTVTCLDEE